MLHTPDNFQYARSAIRDIFYQMPTRTVLLNLWQRYLGQVFESMGKIETELAVEDLKNRGYLIFEETKVRWKDPITLAINEHKNNFPIIYFPVI